MSSTCATPRPRAWRHCCGPSSVPIRLTPPRPGPAADYPSRARRAGQPGGGGAGLSAGTAGAALGGSPAGGGGGGGSGPLAGLIQADAATNSLIITAPEPLYRNIRAIIDKLDVRRAQVVIESLIVEMTADKAAEFGVQWQALGNVNNSDVGVIASQNFGGSGTNIIGTASNLGSVGQGLNLGVINGKINIPGIGEVLNLAFLARALETTADANILSTPTIQTLDNEEAKFLVGQNIPLITGAYANAGGNAVAGVNPFQTFERKDIGLQLRVRPQITEGGVVRLAIYQELSSIQNTLTAAQGGIITNKRSFESTVLVEDGNIVVLGGLIEDRSDNSRSSLPLLGRIPGLGYLFSYENRGRKKTNLFVFLRPYVVREEGKSSALALDRYAYIRGQVSANSIADNFLFRGFQGTQLPENLPVPPAMRRSQDGTTPTPAPSSSTPDTTTGPPVPRAETQASPWPKPTSESPVAASTAPPAASMPPAPAASMAPAAPPTTATTTTAAPMTSTPAPSEPARAVEAATTTTVAPAPAVASPAATPTVTTPTATAAPPRPPVAETTPATSSASISPPVAAPVERAAVEPLPSTVAQTPPTPAAPAITTPAPDVRPATTPSPAPVAMAEPPAASPPASAVAPAVSSAAAPSTSGAFSATPGATQGPTSNLLQVAAVSEISRGRELQRQLRAAGFDAYWESVKSKTGAEVVRVRVSVDPATQSMAETVARLKAMGFEPIVVAP